MEQKRGKIIAVCIGNSRKHDPIAIGFMLFKDSRLPILSSIEIHADSGYQGTQRKHPNSKIPIKGKKKILLTKAQKKANQQLSATRVVVENAIRRIKIFRVLAERYRNRRRRFALRLNLIAAICNYQL